MSGNTPKNPVKPPGKLPRTGRRREDQGNVSVTPINPPAVGGGGIQRGDGKTGPQGPKKK
jgi:hypothetical protein